MSADQTLLKGRVIATQPGDLLEGVGMKATEEVEPVRTLSGTVNTLNETTVSDDKGQREAQLADLPVTDEQADETKGGPAAAARWSQIIIGDLPPAY
jgi:hypothetical protein